MAGKKWNKDFSILKSENYSGTLKIRTNCKVTTETDTLHTPPKKEIKRF